MTAVCNRRKRFLKTDLAKDLLLSVMREVKTEKPYAMIGYVILDDHFHWMIKTPTSATLTPRRSGYPAPDFDPQTLKKDKRIEFEIETSSFREAGLPDNSHTHDNTIENTISRIMQSVKLRFTHRYKKKHGIHGSLSLWQRRFWDHIICDEEDYNRHMDYIHYNPVKHKYTARPGDYEWSSFPTYAERGMYEPDWGVTGEPHDLSGLDFE